MRIAISSLSGCGNSTVSRIVAKKLGLEFINYTFRNLARDTNVLFETIQSESLKTPNYDYEVDRRQIALIQQHDHCVVGSRLAVWLDDEKIRKKIAVKAPDFDFKVWIYAPLKERAARIARREHAPVPQVLSATKLRDAQNELRYRKLYGIDVERFPKAVDLTINTERFSAEQVAALIISSARKVKSLKSR
ncbi:AAA family ATPase [Candidatus Micrarchaeota archaeon]|nr:AAA family ATPase [Candidatus Micrarchaeota archaeon]